MFSIGIVIWCLIGIATCYRFCLAYPFFKDASAIPLYSFFMLMGPMSLWFVYCFLLGEEIKRNIFTTKTQWWKAFREFNKVMFASKTEEK